MKIHNLEKNSRTYKKYITAALIFLCVLVSIAAAAQVYNPNILKTINFSSGGSEISSDEQTAIVSVGENFTGSLEDSSGITMSFGFAPQAVATVEKIPETLEEAFVYPNPIKPGSGGEFDSSHLNISGLTEGTEVSIYNIAGERVRELSNDSNLSEIQWDLRNESGKSVASGVYIYYITDKEGKTTSGRFGLVR